MDALILPRARILVVDDQPAKRLALTAALDALEQDVVQAASGREALRHLLTSEFAVILLDVRMPDMDGFETARLIRSRQQTESTPIIFVTAHDRAEADMLSGYTLGAVDFIYSPVQAEVLRAKVSVFVDLHLKTLTVQAQERRVRELENQQAQHELLKLSSAIAQSADPVMITDRDGIIEYVNGAFEAVTGYSAAETLGRTPDFLHDGLQSAGEQQGMWRTLLGGQVYRAELTSRRKNGEEYHENKTITPIRNAAGHITHFVATSQDVTYRKRMEAELHALNASLEERVRDRTAALEDVNSELEAYAYSISHDLRTPLRHIASFADLLERTSHDQLSHNAQRYLRIIQEGAVRMEALINGLLDFAKTGRQEMTRQPLELGNLVTEIIGELRREPGAQQVTWTLGELHTVQGDLLGVRQVLTNLLTNAVKYSDPERPAQVEIWSELLADEHVVHVRDNGVGFNMAYGHRLFTVFQRLHTTVEGYGVGLAIVKRIVNRHGGHVWAQGEEGRGATFSFSLPHVPTETEADSAHRVPHP
ncbi:response regulator [Deinococcus taeanensis]|uniref:sensor histidine kinase n=1 Tax=Deinococcus taeanensis TaxID=2737050 RepID=UPI001CDC8B5C|nr:ATP-binding protein [Deinococcus taeanensis]UBV42000.1 response regulator [Deinococcus taeanensis]